MVFLLARRIGFAPAGVPRYGVVAPENRTRHRRRAREVRMGSNLAIVTLVLVFSVVIGIVLGRKLRRK
jgi:hypothetical protein